MPVYPFPGRVDRYEPERAYLHLQDLETLTHMIHQ
jgi:hypothetical protein